MERRVVRAILDGMTTDAELAAHFCVERSTVSTHLVNIFRKLHVRRRTELVLKAMQEPWLGDESGA